MTERPKGGIEQARKNLMREDPELYAYIEACVAMRELDKAGDMVSGALDGHGAANLVWQFASQWRDKWILLLSGTNSAAVSVLTGFSKETLDDLGGVLEDD